MKGNNDYTNEDCQQL